MKHAFVVARNHDPPAPIATHGAAVARRAVACASLEQRARDAIQHDVGDMTAEVAERGDPGLVEDRITKLAEGPCGWH